MDKAFYDELKKLYSVEDFTGNLGILLGNGSDYENKLEQERAEKQALSFLQSIYDLAIKHIGHRSII